jgi:hypothetical protein
MDLIYSRKPSSPSASIFSGVSTALNSVAVARLTPLSVACAESTTATRKVKSLTDLSSPFGSGSISWKRRKISSISGGFKRLAFAMNSLLNNTVS